MKAVYRVTITSLFCLSISMAAVTSTVFADNVHTCSKPKYNGNRLDWCLMPSKQCGKPAADAFCKLIGGDEALALPYDYNISKTSIIGTGTICTSPPYDHCDGFKSITCRKWDAKPWPWNSQSKNICPPVILIPH